MTRRSPSRRTAVAPYLIGGNAPAAPAFTAAVATGGWVGRNATHYERGMAAGPCLPCGASGRADLLVVDATVDNLDQAA